MKIKLIFRWYDLWVGLFIDRENKTLYFFPFPMIGFKIALPPCRHKNTFNKYWPDGSGRETCSDCKMVRQILENMTTDWEEDGFK